MITPIYDTLTSSRDNSYPASSSDSERDGPRRPRAVYTDSEDEDYRSRPRTPPRYEPSYRTSSRRHDYRRDYDDEEERPRYPSSDVYPDHGYPRTSAVHSDYGYPSSSRHEPLGSHGYDSHDLQRPFEGSRGDILDEVRKYLQILPPAPDFCWSKCNGRKKAVCIGINYVGQKDALKGCGNDALNIRNFIIRCYGFKPEDILLLIDDGHSNGVRPTRKEMFNAMAWLVKDARPHDSLFFHYSGHGGQTPSETAREADGMDEVIFPVDFKEAGDIIDDELHEALVSPLPPGCRLTAIFDACHSGTVLDLPYLHSAHGRLRGLHHISLRARKRGVASAADVICFSACKDDETSADTFIGGVNVGAMSDAFVRSLEQNPHLTYDELLKELRDILIPEYQQKAQISGTHPLDLNRPFIL
ncbi:hypothetical protein M413DRAFT_448236 [Hebeloma cylindrosporum]|uniref:Peptidase C14 caspase domain-containing protein n=1 Tax=Hebeloma cylindrosporum TaxID=76867 RepID=A0A0C2XIS6_HEBCY|nr:hypothetical protein M413DRAFT_448236 [Hebeloma cylindrosporum h7]